MEDTNLIACLYPVSRRVTVDRALYTIRMRENKRFYFFPPFRFTAGSQRDAETANADSRDRYVGEEEDDDGSDDEKEVEKHEMDLQGERLRLCFGQQRKNQHGFLIGSHRDCDIVLPTEPGLTLVGEYQCLITFDQYGRLILRDLREPDPAGTQDGTVVTYDGVGEHPRRGFTWILSGERFTEKRVEIWLHHRIRFLLVVAPHDIQSVDYLEKIVKFREMETSGPDQPLLQQESKLDDLFLSSPSRSEGPRTVRDPIFLDDIHIGEGGQAVVKRVWDISTGLQYASKEPLGIKQTHWRYFKREAEMLKQLRHSNIVKCMFITEVPKLRAILEYLPLGSLDDQARKRPISSSENLQVLIQGLKALCFLHERDKPIAHRDIKPDNILVGSRDPLHIKLSDFGLSKKSQRDLKTYCGTERYMAPEIQSQETYDEAVDIWSLGLLVLQYAHGFPSSKVMTGRIWAERITEHVEEKVKAEKCPLLGFLQQHMLLIDPERRSWVRRCSTTASKLEAPGCCAQRATSTTSQTVSDPNSEDDDWTCAVIPYQQGSRKEKASPVIEKADEKTIGENPPARTDTRPEHETMHQKTNVKATGTQTLLSASLHSPKQTKRQNPNITLTSEHPPARASHAPSNPRKRKCAGSDISTSPSQHGKRFKLVMVRERPFSLAFLSRRRCPQSMIEIPSDSFWVMPKLGKKATQGFDFTLEKVGFKE